MRVDSGYGCLDHFLEGDTVLHSWEVMAKILASEEAEGILCDIGMYVNSTLLWLADQMLSNQARYSQERDLQLPGHYLQPEDLAYPPEDVARE